MEYILLLYSQEDGWNRMTPEQQQQGFAAYMAYNEALQKAGLYKGGQRLRPVASSTTIRVADGKTQVVDGPYVESKEQLGGYYLIDAPDLDTALAWAARCPGASHGTVEVRPIWPLDASQTYSEPKAVAARAS